MNEHFAPCFFSVKAVDEAAQNIATKLSPAAAMDIVEVTMTSADFGHDVSALLNMDAVVKQAVEQLDEVQIIEKYNPLYLPNAMEQLDEMLELQLRSDAVKFTGLDGSPFTIKMTDVVKDSGSLVMARTQYHPFELPSYTEIADAHEHASIN